MTTSFDRVRPRSSADAPGSALADAEGKRALFSSNAPEGDVPGTAGTVTVECSRCGESTGLNPLAAARVAIPSLLLSVDIGRGDRESTVGLFRRRYGAFLRCPACGRGSWTRLTVRL